MQKLVRMFNTVLAACVLASALWSATAQAQNVSETMTDRCSGDVIISNAYNENWPASGIAIMRSPNQDYTQWSPWLAVNGHTWIRWWCHSTTGNFLDLGTWRIDEASVAVQCDCDWDNPDGEGCGTDCVPSADGTGISISSSDRDGWTPERSRCDSSSTRHISARLGPNRLLQIRCISD